MILTVLRDLPTVYFSPLRRKIYQLPLAGSVIANYA